MLCQSRLHCLRNIRRNKKIGPSLIFCVFASEASILIRKDDWYEKTNILDSLSKDL